jgi:hypothetical protein
MFSIKNFTFCIASFSLLPTPLASQHQQSCSSFSTSYPGDQDVSFSKIPFSGQEVVSSSSAYPPNPTNGSTEMVARPYWRLLQAPKLN